MNKIKYISVFTVAMIVLTVLVGFVASLFNADISSRFWIVPLYFWIFYSVAILLFNGKANQANCFMLFKGTKMLATLVVIFASAFVMRSHTVELILYFLVYYIVLLVVESSFLLYIKKRGRK
jgi:hypothetical protein